jgi:pilus assembly protein CpaE
MAFDLRVCLFDMRGAAESLLRSTFEAAGDIRIVDECSAWEAMQDHLRMGQVDIVALNLDTDDPKFALHVVQRIAEVAPECGILAISRSADPNTIIAAMRAGCHQFVRAPIDLEDLRGALERIRQTMVPLSVTSQRFGVIGSSGGAGATTVACNLALELAHLTTRAAALVDLNLRFGDVACAFDCQPRYSVADVCRGGAEIDRTMIEPALHELPCNVALLGRPEKVEDADDVQPEGVEQMFRVLAQMYPFIVVDLPRSLTPPAVAGLNGADRIIIVAQLSVPCLRNATRLYECLLNLGVNQDRVEIVLNRCNANYERIKPEEVEKHFGRPIFAVIPNDYRRVTTSRDLGHPIMTDSPNSPARMAIHNMARTLAASQIVDEGGGDGGLLGMFRKKRARGKQQPV